MLFNKFPCNEYSLINYKPMQQAQRAKTISVLPLKKLQRIHRHRLPNLYRSGEKFSPPRDAPLFFSKIANTFKLLQSPNLTLQTKTRYFTNRESHPSPPTSKKKSFLRIQSLSKPRTQSNSQSIQIKNNKKHHYQIKFKKSNPSSINQPTILASDFGTESLDQSFDKILSQRNQKSKLNQSLLNLIKHKTYKNNQQQSPKPQQSLSTIQDLKPVTNNFNQWINKIIGQNPNLYQKLNKQLMKNVKNIQPCKQINLHCCSAWR